MIVGSGWWDVVGGFLGEDQSVVGEFGGKGLLRFCLFSSGGKFSSSGDCGYLFFQKRASAEEARSTLNDPVEGSVCICSC